MVICKKFKPLFDLPKARGKLNKKDLKNRDYWESLSKVSYVCVTGGRESSKTFTCTLAANDRVVNHGYRELYTRYTLTSAEKSIIPAFLNRSESLGYDSWLRPVGKSIKCDYSGGYVDFSGIKTSSGNQTASLKSLENYSCFTCEEFEEYQSREEFEKIEESIRSKDVQPFTVCIMNPTTKKHWAYDFFFKERGVREGFNGIKGEVLYIHTTYLDLGPKYVATKNWNKFEAARIVYERVEPLSKYDREKLPQDDIRLWKYYKFNVLGGWKDSAEGLIFEDWDLFEEYPEEGKPLKIFGLDFGFSTDPAALCEARIYPHDIYLREHIYETGLLNHELAERINIISAGEEIFVVADNARPDTIAELNRIAVKERYTFRVIPCKKGQGSVKDGLDKMKDKNIHVHKESLNLIDEFNHYHTITIINSKGEKTEHIVDANNHGIDAARYGVTRYSS
jgi:phage terminase large subunit